MNGKRICGLVGEGEGGWVYKMKMDYNIVMLFFYYDLIHPKRKKNLTKEKVERRICGLFN